jgi:hypothetical protein
MKVVSISDKSKEKKKADLLETLDHLRKQVEDGDITEFVVSSIDEEGNVQIHVACMDFPGAIGLFEIGKHILISKEA